MKKIRLALGMLGIFLVLASFSTAHEGLNDYGHHSMMEGMMFGGYGYGGMLFGWLIGILFVVVLVLLVVWLIKQIQKK